MVYDTIMLLHPGQVGPRFGNSWSFVEWKWYHYIMAEANIHLRPLLTSILDKTFWVMGMLSQGLMGAPSCCYTGQVGPRLGSLGHSWSGHNTITSWLRLTFISYTPHIHVRYIKCVWVIGMLSQGHLWVHPHHYTGQVPRFGNSGSLDNWKWYHCIMVEADIHLSPLSTSILDIYKVFEQ